MTASIDNGFAAYVRLRQRAPSASPAEGLRARRQQIELEIRSLQEILGHTTRFAVARDQGVLFAWAHLRVTVDDQLIDLASQPWLRKLDLGADGASVRLVAGLSDGRRRLVISLRADATRQVRIHKPLLLPTQDTPLFRATLHGLLAEGRLAEIMVVCAQRLGLSLASRLADPPVVVAEAVSRAYFRQRAAWLTEHGFLSTPGAADTDLIAAQLDDLYHTLFILDRELDELRRQAQSPDLLHHYREEWQQLQTLPSVQSIRVQADTVEVRTESITVQGICLGEFRIAYDLAANRMSIANISRPLLEGDARYDHPHVREGVPCLGNIQKHVQELLASRNLVQLIPVTLDFLQSYNPSSPHRNLDAWR